LNNGVYIKQEIEQFMRGRGRYTRQFRVTKRMEIQIGLFSFLL